ncbi:RagB/SusD family nutrient uptake outer membrane protein [Parapedobacter sp. SGR-10]|uniref:RagB/SusD family nutrient uptake outer membrane protein n=1 Tax=Parapedobacter sp. SGR-10 TaxID=2710879 RepID=UPI0013D083F3|nr:RagB/SusD family nutrient uptake outer membrane protein [Parapedobacter sp. SGR-10]NGF57630.1 RagB/SusD family nutrient uptake outer membrane protein [Parapedobacter sp. SGR-10]
MKNIILKLMAVGVIFLSGSCKKFLETEPTDFLAPSIYYETEQQLDYALTGVYDRLGMNRLYGAYLHTLHNMEADEGFVSVDTWVTGTRVNNFSVSDPDVLNLWRYIYEAIGRANMLLANVDNNTDIDIAYRDQVRGEALFLRAYYYFMLVQFFENVPMYLTPVANHTQVDVPATPAKEVYEQIIADMETAEALVAPISEIGFGGRVSKSAVRGILARVCLNMAGRPVQDISKYERASYWAKKVMDDNVAAHALNPDYTDVFIKYARDEYDIKESIWEVELWGYNTTANQESGYVGSWIGIKNGTGNNRGYSLGRIYATAKHYHTYEEGDLRRDWNIAPFTYHSTTGAYIMKDANSLYDRYAGKYRREYELNPSIKQPTPINFPLLRYSDILLMYAEAENAVHSGPTEEALEAINMVRRRGFGKLATGATDVDAYDLPAGLDQFKFFQAIVDERTRELSFEALRRPDLIRWGIYVETMKETLAEMNTDLGAGAWQSLTFRNASERYTVYPTPSYELGLNKALEQHPLWR